MKREIKFRAWDKRFDLMLENVVVYDNDNIIVVDVYANEVYDEKIDYLEMNDAGFEHYCITSDFEMMQFTGMADKRNNRDIYESDIYFEEDAQDTGDRRIYFVVAWINERSAFAMLEVSEYNNYINEGFNAIERDFDGFYFELSQDSFDKMHHAGNIYQNTELLS